MHMNPIRRHILPPHSIFLVKMKVIVSWLKRPLRVNGKENDQSQRVKVFSMQDAWWREMSTL